MSKDKKFDIFEMNVRTFIDMIYILHLSNCIEKHYAEFVSIDQSSIPDLTNKKAKTIIMFKIDILCLSCDDYRVTLLSKRYLRE